MRLNLAPGIWFRQFIAGALALVSVAAAAACPPGSFALSLVPARTSGVAPLYVFFDGSGTTSPAVTSKPFHEIEYRWNFGDPGSGRWTTGIRPKADSRNLATGPMAGHVFESAGVYKVTLTAFDGVNTATCNVQITVTAPDAYFASPTGSTACVSAAGNFTGCPSGATQITSSAFDTQVRNHIGSNKRILFNRGETFTCASTINKGGAGPILIGAYGSGAIPIVNLGSNNGACFQINTTSASDWRVMDLQFNDNGHIGTVCIGANSAPNKSQLTFLRLTCNGAPNVNGMAQGVLVNANYPSGPKADQIALVDSTFNNISGQATFIAGVTRYFEAGNYINGGCCAPTGGGIINQTRHLGVQKGITSYNTIAGVNASGPQYGSALTERTGFQGATDANPGDSIIISNNHIDAGNNFFGISINPSLGTDQQQRDVIVERNFVKNTSVNGGKAIDVEGVDHATIRNNTIIFGATPASANGPQAIQIKSGGPGVNATNNVVYNNSIYGNESTRFTECVRMDSKGVVGTIVRNNACYAPGSGAVFLNDLGAGTTVSNNSSDIQVRTVAPAGWLLPPKSYRDFKPTGG